MTDPVSSTPAARPAASGLAERIADNLTRFTAALHQHPYWHLLPAGAHELARSTGVFDARAGIVYRTSEAALEAWLAQHSFVFVEARDRPGHHLATLQCATRMLWNHETSDVDYSLDAARQVVGQGRWAGLKGKRVERKRCKRARFSRDMVSGAISTLMSWFLRHTRRWLRLWRSRSGRRRMGTHRRHSGQRMVYRQLPLRR